MAAGGKRKDGRTQRERARVYEARKEYNAGRVRRRTRDNVIGGIAGGVLLLVIAGAQVAYYTAGPGKTAPEPTHSSTPAVTAPAPVETTPAPATTP